MFAVEVAGVAGGHGPSTGCYARPSLHMRSPMQSQTTAMTLLGVAGVVVLSQLVHVVLCWLASKLVTPATATLGRAALWWLLNLLLSVVAFVPFLLVVGLVAASGGLGLFLLLVLAVAFIVVAFLIPMRLYGIGAGRALVLMLGVYVLQLLLGLALRPFLPASSQPDLRQLAARVQSAGVRAPSVRPTAPAPSPPRPGVREVTIVEPVRVPVVDDDGKVIGDIELEMGTRVEFLGLEGSTVEIRYLDAVARIPRRKTDY